MNRPAVETVRGVDADDATGRPPSLRRSLLTWLLLPLWILVPLAAALVYFLALEPALDSLDRALTDTALALSGILQSQHGVPSLPISDQTARALTSDLLDEVVFAVGDGRDRLLGGNPALLALARPVLPGQKLFLDVPWHGHAMRMVIYGAPCGDLPTLTGGQVHTWQSALAEAPLQGELNADPQDLSVLPYTSGTTGLPKGCMHTHASIMHNAVACGLWGSATSETVALVVVPMFHITGMVAVLHAGIFCGATMVVMPR